MSGDRAARVRGRSVFAEHGTVCGKGVACDRIYAAARRRAVARDCAAGHIDRSVFQIDTAAFIVRAIVDDKGVFERGGDVLVLIDRARLTVGAVVCDKSVFNADAARFVTDMYRAAVVGGAVAPDNTADDIQLTAYKNTAAVCSLVARNIDVIKIQGRGFCDIYAAAVSCVAALDDAAACGIADPRFRAALEPENMTVAVGACTVPVDRVTHKLDGDSFICYLDRMTVVHGRIRDIFGDHDGRSVRSIFGRRFQIIPIIDRIILIYI